MRILILMLAGGFLLSGCAKVKSWLPSRPNATDPVAGESTGPIITAATANSGRVAKVNPNGRFVVITFLPGEVPAIERKFNVYRGGLKVAEVKITGPQRDNNTVADIIAGEVRVNDEVRAD